jgi:hypothetical protein
MITSRISGVSRRTAVTYAANSARASGVSGVVEEPAW